MMLFPTAPAIRPETALVKAEVYLSFEGVSSL